MNNKKSFKTLLTIFMIGLMIIVPITFYGCTISNDYINIPSSSYEATNTTIFRDSFGYNSVKLNENRDIRVLQLTDIHIGNGIFCVKKDRKALEDVCALIEETKPDLIVLTGDVVYPILVVTGSNDNLSAMKVIAEVVDAYKTPWTFVFGNHDAEPVAKYSKSEICNYLESDQLEYCLFDRGSEELEGMGNHIINVYNFDDSFNTSIVLFDNGEYKSGTQMSGYNPISQAQTNWYVNSLIEINDTLNLEYTIQSFIFYHVPSKDYGDAWKKYREGDEDIIYHYGWANEKNEEISSPSEDSPLLDAIIELGSTKGIFCGHNHLNDFSVTYKGVRLTFGKSIDYTAYLGIVNKTEQRGATLLTLKNKGTSFDITPIKIEDIR